MDNANVAICWFEIPTDDMGRLKLLFDVSHFQSIEKAKGIFPFAFFV